MICVLVDFGIKHNVDIIAASFVRKASDVEYIREVLGAKGKHIKIVSKIENQEGLENFEEIMMASDGIMVARGDLGMEIPTEKVFLAQKYMIDRCNAFGKPVIVATQMLESMIVNPRPTRAEASDVANAVIDGADWVMLSGETANGEFPVAAVKMMASIATEAESTLNYSFLYDEMIKKSPTPFITSEILAAATASAALSLKIDLIVVMTQSGELPELIAKYRPHQFIFACCTSHSVVRQLNLVRGVIGYKIPSFDGVDQLMKIIVKAARSMNLWTVGHTVLTLRALKADKQDNTSLMEILEIE